MSAEKRLKELGIDLGTVTSPVANYVNAVRTGNLLFLAGKGDITRDFVATGAESTVPGTIAVKLTPRRPEPEYDYLVVSADPVTFQIRALTTRDRQGGESTLLLTKLKENQGISDKEFGFVIPRGVDVSDNTRN